VDGNGWAPLHEAVRSGHVDVVQFLIDNGANYNEITVQDLSPLYIARNHFGEDHPMTKFLVNLGAIHVGPEL
jgi:prolyl 4-hydroxylase